MLTSIDVKFPSSFACFSASSGEKGEIRFADILQIVNIFGRVVRVFLLFLVVVRLSSSVQNVWNIPPSSYCSPETTTTSIDSRASELLSIILTFMLYLYWCHFPHIAKRLPNLVNARWLWRISLGIWANQKPRTISWAISQIMGFPIIIIWRKFWRNYGIDWDIQKDGGCPSGQKSAS